MTTTADDRLHELGLHLPDPVTAPTYAATVRTGSLLLVSGQLPLQDGALVATGLVGRDIDLPVAQRAARACALNVLAQARSAVGDLESIRRLVKITVFVAGSPDFTEQHLVANAASTLFVDVLGDRGRHARSAIGVSALPMNAAVEIEAFVEAV